MYHKACIFLVALVLSACGNQESTTETPAAYTEVQAAEISAGDSVPEPSGEVVLTITGNISVTNVGDTLQFDIATLEKLGVVEYSVDDKQAEGRVATFQGVLLSHILDVAGIGDDVSILHTIALNDYAVDIPIEDARNYPVLVATSVDGERMSVERYGPTRIIYPYGLFDLDETVYDPRWVWQLATIELR